MTANKQVSQKLLLLPLVVSAIFFFTNAGLWLISSRPAIAVSCSNDFESVRCLAQAELRNRIIVAHRANFEPQNEDYFENSSAAILRTLNNGVPIVELDLRLSTDGKLFLFHDKIPNKDIWHFPPNPTPPPIESASSDQLGVAHRKGGGITFFDSISLPEDHGLILWDIKGDFAAVLKQLASAGAAKGLNQRSFVEADNAERIEQIRKAHSQFGVMARISSEFDLSSALRFKPELIQIDFGPQAPSEIKQAHEFQSKVIIKTLGEDDRPENWKALIDAGADALMTNRAKEVFKSGLLERSVRPTGGAGHYP